MGQECAQRNGPLGSCRDSFLTRGTRRIDPTKNHERGSDIQRLSDFYGPNSLGEQCGYENAVITMRAALLTHSCYRSIRYWF